MNWDALGAIAELLGAVAVLPSRILIVQVRQPADRAEQVFAVNQRNTPLRYCAFAVNETNNIEVMGKAVFEPVSLEMRKWSRKFQLIV